MTDNQMEKALTEGTEPQRQEGTGISRRKLLASLGMTGAAVFSGGLLMNSLTGTVSGSGVTNSVYGRPGGPAHSQGQPFNQLNDAPPTNIPPTILDYFTTTELEAFHVNPAMDCTAIVQRAFAAGVQKLDFLDLHLHITLATNGLEPLGTFTSGAVELYGNGAKFIDDTVHVMHGAFVPLFVLGGGVTSFISNIDYSGQPVSLSTEIGYRGATYVYSKGANKNIEVTAKLENLRYGILAGHYADPTLGGAKRIRGYLECKNVGYPIATYLADDIEMEITGEGFHRVHYIAGCDHARIKALTKNYYIAPIACLYSDAKTGDGTSKGCTDCKTKIVDQGSTAYVTNSWLCGVSLSRVDPNTVFDDITLDATVVSSDTVASKLGHSIVNSNVRPYQPSYPANWTSEIYLKRIKLKGLIDRSAQTIEEHGVGEIYFSPLDSTSVAGQTYSGTVSGFECSDLEYRGGTGNKPKGFWYRLEGLVDKATFDNVNIPGNAPILMRSNTTSETLITNCKLLGLDVNNSASFNSKVSIVDSEIYGGELYLPRVNKRMINTKIGSNRDSMIQMVSKEIVLSGASVTWASSLPIHAMILGVSCVITETIVGTSGLFIGDGTTHNKFFSSPVTAQGSGLGFSNLQPGAVPYITPGTRSIVVTARDSGGGTSGTFTSGKVKVLVHYLEIGVPNF